MIRLVSGTGATVSEYEYDPYGRVIFGTGTMAEVNPLRYRGYYYDAETEFYYLQSRYYDPTICRFINADGYASTGQGFLGWNMFAYCNNAPTMYGDPNGKSLRPTTVVMPDSGSIVKKDTVEVVPTPTRDVTDEVTTALDAAVANIVQPIKWHDYLSTAGRIRIGAIYLEFYNLVNHGAPWDIKIEKCWKDTIGTAFPGEGVEVLFEGVAMTPEALGNFTYGYLGYSYGISLNVLFAGSEYAAGFPSEGSALENELIDQRYVEMGYNYAKYGTMKGG